VDSADKLATLQKRGLSCFKCAMLSRFLLFRLLKILLKRESIGTPVASRNKAPFKFLLSTSWWSRIKHAYSLSWKLFILDGSVAKKFAEPMIAKHRDVKVKNQTVVEELLAVKTLSNRSI
jgi:hypothetical protein